MIFKKLVQRIKIFSNGNEKSDLPMPMEFHAVLAKERARSDRNGHGFSVAIFRVSKDLVSRSGHVLGSILHGQMRDTDEVGWFNEESIGVLLYNTGTSGAWEYVNNVRLLIDQQDIPHTCSVYLYPDDWTHMDNNSEQPGSQRASGTNEHHINTTKEKQVTIVTS